MTKTRRTPRLAAIVAATLALGVATPSAYAAGGTASDDQYGGVLGQEAGGQGGGSLPFTGLDLVVVLAAGTGLTAAGVAMRRTAHTN